MVVGLGFLELSVFWNVGYTVKRKVFSRALCEQALEEVQELEFKPIFRKIYAKRLDPFREQVAIDVLEDGVSSIHSMVAGLVEGANNLWEVNVSTWHALKSTPGGTTQAVHQDYPQFEISRALLKHKLVQGSVIVALMKKPLLHVYPRCFGGQAEKGARVTLTFNEGDMVLFWGGLAHAGAKYDDENIRLHCYVRVKVIKHRSNATEAVPFKSYGCSKCMGLYDSRQGLRAHKLVCDFEADFPCPYCDDSFNKPNTLTKHISRKHPGEHRARRSTRDADEEMNEANESNIQDEDGDDKEDSEDDEQYEDREEEDYDDEEESKSDLSEPGESSSDEQMSERSSADSMEQMSDGELEDSEFDL